MSTIMQVRAGDEFAFGADSGTIWVCASAPFLDPANDMVAIEATPKQRPWDVQRWTLPDVPVVLCRAYRLVEVPCLLCAQPQRVRTDIAAEATVLAVMCELCDEKTTKAVHAMRGTGD